MAKPFTRWIRKEHTMEPIATGWFSVLPPILAIVIALFTKDVVFSLLIGIFSGTLTYCIFTGTNLLIGPIEVFFQTAINRIDLHILFFVFMLGAIVQVISLSGGSRAYAKWAQKYLKTRRSTLLATVVLGVLIFVDDYFNCLTVGTVMSPLAERHKVSKAKLAYLIDSTAAPVCIIAPISSWAAAVGSSLQATGAFQSDLVAFCTTIPYNLYALLTIFMVLFLAIKEMDFGPMFLQEQAALLSAQKKKEEDLDPSDQTPSGTVMDMIFPIVTLILLSILGMLYNGGFWNPSGNSYHSLTGAFGNCSASQALCFGGFGTLIITFLLYIPRKIMNFSTFMENTTKGFQNMIAANTVLLLAWTISGVCRDLLMTAEFVRDLFTAIRIPSMLLPALIFVVAAFLSFSIGSSWGTFGILIPIIVPVASTLSPSLLTVALSATLGGSIFGDHCSPISDTTILSSTGSGCDHLLHVSTQMPYALTVASCSIIGYLIAGFSDGNLLLTLSASIILLTAAIIFLHKRSLHTVNAKTAD